LVTVASGVESFSFYRQASIGRGMDSAFRFASAQQQGYGKQEPKLSEDERRAATKINEAKGAEAKLQTAAAFIKKYPKSALRSQVAGYITGQIWDVKDSALKISLAETYLTFFTEPSEAALIQPLLIDDYLDNNRLDDGFKLAATYLEKHPEEVSVLARLALAGSNEVAHGNTKLLEQSQQYGMKAIELIEADKKPASMEAAKWPEYKTRWLPALYREMGVLALRTNNPAEAKLRMEKAAALKTTDPSVYFVLGNMADNEYTALATKYKSIPAGAERDAALKKAEEQLDRVIQLYAQTAALAEGKPEYKQIYDQLTPSLQSYYKYRHSGSTDGLQQLIDKYKKAP
jgi:hypothetical protein